jgi:DNA-binding NarL/FixJ family response regulator
MITRLSELSQLCADTEGIMQKVEALTPRECEVLEWVSEGLTNKEIGERLTIELGTVKNHIHNILEKLEVGNRHKAAEIFQQQQAIPVNGLIQDKAPALKG